MAKVAFDIGAFSLPEPPPADTLLFHVTAARNRLAIERFGLKARKTAEHNFGPRCFDNSMVRNQPVGVYGTRAGMRCFSHSTDAIPDLRRHVWSIDIRGLPTIPDPVLGGAWALCVPVDIPPERLELVHCFTIIKDPTPVITDDGKVWNA